MSKVRSGTAQPGAARTPRPVEPAFLAVGKLLHAHGVHGEIFMEVHTDFPERLVPGMTLFLGSAGGSLHLIRRRAHKDGLLMTFDGYTTPEAVGQLRNQLLYVRADDRPPLAEGEYYQHQVLNQHVSSDTGESIGVVTEILETGATDVLVIRRESGREVLIPIVDRFVQKIDLQSGEITVHLIPGMLEEEP
ncbi:MAG TPA: ribosome maturation factor RimM [Anaerolineales bacterium]|nr:ribosome maturation factor RimM [Anaerolineales bacterium]